MEFLGVGLIQKGVFMSLDKISNELLYVPFTNEYEVPSTIKSALTCSEFFAPNGCFIGPNFDKKIEELEKLAADDLEAEGYPVCKSDLLKIYNKGKNEEQRLLNWFTTDGEGIYCILGDAGTGKTTYLHFLKWDQQIWNWEIIDVQKATIDIEVVGSEINFSSKDFSFLHGKVISSLLSEILDSLFIIRDGTEYDYEESAKNIQLLLKAYDKKIINLSPLKDYRILYDTLKDVKYAHINETSNREYCEACAEIIANYFNGKCTQINKDEETQRRILKCVLTHFLIFSRCLKENRKIIFVFDNIERFIGADEIFNSELSAFASHLRSICDTYGKRYKNETINSNLFSKNYQFVLAMRNTTVRQYTPQQNTDFFPHTVDVSTWFSTNHIIHSKLDWYKKHNIEIPNEINTTQLLYILDDMGLTSSATIRGLRPKMNLVFNYNKRLTISFLVNALTAAENKKFLNVASAFWKIDAENPEGANNIRQLSRFAYRSIIWRLIFNQLRSGGLFSAIYKENSKKAERRRETNYTWGILTILFNFYLIEEEKKREENRKTYMAFPDLMKKFYWEEGPFSSWFYSENYDLERPRIARILHGMNYYDQRVNHWFQFVDIQYNVNIADKKRLHESKDFLNLLMEMKDNPYDLKVRITKAGRAYLGYIVQTFEFFSCLNDETYPLLCCLPTLIELEDADLDSLKCVKVIRSTLNEMDEYVKNAQKLKGYPYLLYKKNINDPGQLFVTRMVHSCTGFLANFCQCVDAFVITDIKSINEKKRELIDLILNEAKNFEKRWLTKTDKK